MIVNFKCKFTEELWVTGKCKKFPPETIKAALRKLLMIDSSHSVNDLRIPPGNHLEGLVKERRGQYSIRINHRLRICFVFEDQNACDVEIVDYH